MTKKKWVIRNFGGETGHFSRKKPQSEILVHEKCCRPPRLGTRSPPLIQPVWCQCIHSRQVSWLRSTSGAKYYLRTISDLWQIWTSDFSTDHWTFTHTKNAIPKT